MASCIFQIAILNASASHYFSSRPRGIICTSVAIRRSICHTTSERRAQQKICIANGASRAQPIAVTAMGKPQSPNRKPTSTRPPINVSRRHDSKADQSGNGTARCAIRSTRSNNTCSANQDGQLAITPTTAQVIAPQSPPPDWLRRRITSNTVPCEKYP